MEEPCMGVEGFLVRRWEFAELIFGDKKGGPVGPSP